MIAWSASSNSASIQCAGLGGDSKTTPDVFFAKSMGCRGANAQRLLFE